MDGWMAGRKEEMRTSRNAQHRQQRWEDVKRKSTQPWRRPHTARALDPPPSTGTSSAASQTHGRARWKLQEKMGQNICARQLAQTSEVTNSRIWKEYSHKLDFNAL